MGVINIQATHVSEHFSQAVRAPIVKMAVVNRTERHGFTLVVSTAFLKGNDMRKL
jgi:hypothetical protein